MISEEPEQDQENESAGTVEEEEPPEISEARAWLHPFAAVPLRVSIGLGRSTLKISDLLGLGYHSVVELDKPVGNNLDVYINGVLLGRGEVVIVEDKVGIKINEVVDHSSWSHGNVTVQ
jgi:flagellar motor switch protein FliN/FliY